MVKKTIDNFDLLPKIIEFKDGTYYRFITIIRDKDNPEFFTDKDGKEMIIKQWMVESEESFKRLIPFMKGLASKTGARLYMGVNRKSVIRTLITILRDTTTRIENYTLNPKSFSTKKIGKTAISASADKSSNDSARMKKIKLDVDTKDPSILNRALEECKLGNPVVFPTRNGYHIVADRSFDVRKITQEKGVVGEERDSMVLVYMEYEDER